MNPDIDDSYWERRQSVSTNGPPITPAPPLPRRMKQAVPKRPISAPERQASTVASIATRVVERWPKVEAVAAALAAPTLRAVTPQDGGRSADHPDPAASIALGHQDYDDLREAVKAWLEQGKWIEQQQIRYLKDHPATVAAKTDDLKGLCTVGGCDFNAERRGLCWRHYREQLAAEETSPDDVHSTQEAAIHARVATPTPKPVGAYSSARVTCMTCRREYDVPHGVDPQQWLERHRTVWHPA